jgi:hypothetical protein
MFRRAFCVAALVALSAGAARAHVGAIVALARFQNPPPPMTLPTDGGTALLAPYTFATADTSFDIQWTDGDNAPSSLFTFYYLDHNLSFQVTGQDIEKIGTPIVGAEQIWATCDCSSDLGALCPDLMTARYCPNHFVWDTSKIPAGTYWIAAVTNDPPYTVYSISTAPVLIAHGTTPTPPAALILKPDGFGAYDTSYLVQWYASGKAPLRIDLSYGLDAPEKVLDPVTPLAMNVQSPVAADGTQTYVWDVSSLVSNSVYFLRVTVTDGNGVTTYTDSHFGLTVFHPDQGSGDMSMSMMGPQPDLHGPVIDPPLTPRGCHCDVGDEATVALVPSLFGLLICAWLSWRVARRARSR